MAVVQNPIIGRAKGSLANTVFSTWKGQNVIKSKAVSPTNPNTVKQQVQRSIFSRAVQHVRQLQPVLELLYGLVSIKMTAFNYAVKVVTLLYDKVTGDFMQSTLAADTFGAGDSLTATVPTTISRDVNGISLSTDINFASGVVGRTGIIFYIAHCSLLNKFYTSSLPVADYTNGENVVTDFGINAGEEFPELTTGDRVWTIYYDSVTRKVGLVNMQLIPA